MHNLNGVCCTYHIKPLFRNTDKRIKVGKFLPAKQERAALFIFAPLENSFVDRP